MQEIVILRTELPFLLFLAAFSIQFNSGFCRGIFAPGKEWAACGKVEQPRIRAAHILTSAFATAGKLVGTQDKRQVANGE